MADLRCPTCAHVYAFHERDGTCPRWALASLTRGVRVSIRIGTRKYCGAEGHVFAYFADAIHGQMIDAWDLTDDRLEPVPLITLGKETDWTRQAGRDEVDRALDELRMRLGVRVEHVKRIGF